MHVVCRHNSMEAVQKQEAGAGAGSPSKGGRRARVEMWVRKGREGLGEDGRRLLAGLAKGTEELSSQNKKLLKSIKVRQPKIQQSLRLSQIFKT